jgi:hypothetical protein
MQCEIRIKADESRHITFCILELLFFSFNCAAVLYFCFFFWQLLEYSLRVAKRKGGSLPTRKSVFAPYIIIFPLLEYK